MKIIKKACLLIVLALCVGQIYGQRIIMNSGKVRFALEGEYTVANYGSTTDAKGVPTDLTSADNIRVLAAVYYFFK